MSFSSVRDAAHSTGSETTLTHRFFRIVNDGKLRKRVFPQIFDKTLEDTNATKFLYLSSSMEILIEKCTKLWVSSTLGFLAVFSDVTLNGVSFPASCNHSLQLPLPYGSHRSLFSTSCFPCSPYFCSPSACPLCTLFHITILVITFVTVSHDVTITIYHLASWSPVASSD